MSENSGPRTIAIVNQKGGTAKTTTAVSLAEALADLDTEIVVIDLDPQGSATKWLGHSPGMDLAAVLTESRPISEALQSTKVDRLRLVPTSSALAAADRQLSGEPGIQTALRVAVAALPPEVIVLIDCPPTLGLLAIMALAAANEALVPIAAGAMELDGLAELTRTVTKVRSSGLNPGLHIATVLPCRIATAGDRLTRISQAVLDTLGRNFADEMLRLPDGLTPVVVRESTRFKEAPSHRSPIRSYDPDGSGARDYRAAAQALVMRWKGASDVN